MKNLKIVILVLAASFLFAGIPSASAQDDRKKDKKEKEYKEKEKDSKERDKDRKEWEKEKREKAKERNEKDRYDGQDRRDKRDDDQYERRKETRTTRSIGGILGRVITPPPGSASPRQLEGVPKGHYPPPHQCRIWYPNRPPGQQPPPSACDNLRNARLEPGAFILHGDKAYDAEYDWREEERRRPGTVGRDILDILFPAR